MIYDLIIVGCGASGAACAITYKRKNPNNSVLVLESQDEILKKVSATGNGKGNFTNEYLSSDSYNSQVFVSKIINKNSKGELLSFFDSLRMMYYKDAEGRYYPLSSSAKTISYVLKREMDELNVHIKTSYKVNMIEKEDDIFYVSDGKDTFMAYSILLSTGAKNYKSLGSDGSIYPIVESLGHTLTPMYPANIYIKVNEKEYTKKLSGLRFNATIYLINDKEIYYYEKGELLFKDDALSGIVTFNVSNRLAYLYKSGNDNNPELVVDFCNTIDTEDLVNIIYNSKDIKETLMGLVHPSLAELIYQISKDKKEIVQNLASFRFKVKSLGDFEHAQITAGGVKVVEVKDNLESVIVPHLYFAGDILDVDAQCGGYNLSFAFLSGIKAGKEIE